MSGIGDRHSGTAGGALNLGGKPVSVEIRVAGDANRAAVQHTAWMLLNVLSRLEGAVNAVRISCPPDIEVVPKLSPLITNRGSLLEALLAGGHAIGPPQEGFASIERAEQQVSDVVVSVGFEFVADAAFCAVGNGLCGGIFTRDIATPTKLSDLTIGPYVAACIASAEIFRLVRLKNYVAERQLFLSVLDYCHSADPRWSDLEIGGELQSVLLVGVGAVGSALLHALHPLPLRGAIQAADNDPKGIDKTNLGRYPLFGWASVGKAKASEAAQLLCGANFQILTHDGSFEHFFAGGDRPRIVLSAVDNNDARHALQEQYVPMFYSASTHNLRAEILRCGSPSKGACLACFNPLRANDRCEDDIRTLLSERPQLASNLCEKLRLSPEDVAGWIREGKCSKTSERLIEELRTDDGSVPLFAVSFVSVMAGTFLAAELLKIMGNWRGPLNETSNRAVFQLQNPSSPTNKAHFYPRDERCSACSPQNAGVNVWRRRYEQFAKTSFPVTPKTS